MIRFVFMVVLSLGVAHAIDVSETNESSSPSGSSKYVNFENDVMPVLTKAGCNAGVCHAKAGGGQNGFELSLLGFEPREDYEHLVNEGRGRRLFPAAPDQSLLLQKAAGTVPHGGGIRLEKGSKGYQVIRDWIEQGTQWGSGQSALLQRIEVSPSTGVVQRGGEQQLSAIAQYSDGSSRVVTDLALFESNQSALASVDESGLVRVSDLPGNVSIMVRYQGQVAVYRAAVPLGPPVDSQVARQNFVDEHVFENLRVLGIPSSPLCNDSTFIRRVTLDIAGRLPTSGELDQFLTDASPNHRERCIDNLLRTTGYADYFANKWTALLKNRRDEASDITSNFAFHAWIRDSLLSNVPYDQLVRELLAATGTVIANPAVAWYKRVKEPKQQMEDVAQLFLGVRMQCAQCHHHPFERWSQDDYYGLTAFFTQVGRKPTGTRGEDMIFHQRGVAEAKNMKTGLSVRPAALGRGVGEIRPEEDPRLRLANWLSEPENPYFAKSLVNRYWKHFMGRGLIEPEDDIRDTNPPSNPELLDALSESFIASGYNLKDLVKTITMSAAYQLSSVPTEQNQVDLQNYSRYYPKRLQAEVLLDSIDDLTGARTDFANLPTGTRAISLPDNSYNKSSAFLRVFGRPENQSVCECERVETASLAQSLHLINAADIRAKIASANGTASQLASEPEAMADQVREVYRLAFSREVTEQELSVAVAYLSESRFDAEGKPLNEVVARKESFQDLLWAVMNTKEFLFNH
ncbi:MAG: DUF1553 domain-containing protein [Rubripirellula sp.]|nr:DUF1553 domain-containing protein [Rubripirellula sp.]